MTFEDFCTELAAMGRTWRHTKQYEGGFAIRDDNGHCPIVSLARHKLGGRWHNYQIAVCAQRLGIPSDVARLIECIADGTRRPGEAMVDRLLSATGFIPESAVQN